MSNIPKNKISQYALMIADTFNAREDHPNELCPSVEAGTDFSENWVIDGYIMANDSIAGDLARLERDDAFYGYLAHSKSNPKEFVTIIRGTATPIEWMNNLKSNQVRHHDGESKVSNGFYGIYKSMQLIRPGSIVREPVVEAITDIVQRNEGTLTVTGHSLGAALATYLTYDLAKQESLKDTLNMCCFASPKPGDEVFVNKFEETVKQYTVYNYSLDMVPTVPFGFMGYQALKGVRMITPENAEAVIHGDLLSHHHVGSYAAALHWEGIYAWKSTPGPRPNANFQNEAPISWDSMLVRNGCKPFSILGQNAPIEVKTEETTPASTWGDKAQAAKTTVFNNLGTLMAAGGFTSLSNFVSVTAANVTNVVRDGVQEVTPFVQEKIRRVQQWSFQYKLDSEMRSIYDKPPTQETLNELATKIREYTNEAKAMYGPEAYTGASPEDKIGLNRRCMQAQSSIYLVEELRSQKLMVYALNNIASARSITPEHVETLVSYNHQLERRTPQQVMDIEQFKGLIQSTTQQAYAMLSHDVQLQAAGLSDDPVNSKKVVQLAQLKPFVGSGAPSVTLTQDAERNVDYTNTSLAMAM